MVNKILKNKNYMLDLCVRMAHHSTAIEGNTLSQDETASIILDNYISRAVKEREFYEVRNYKNVLPVFIERLESNTKIDNELIKEFHKLIMQDLIENNGSFKKIENMIVGANFEPTKPYLVPVELKNLVDNLYYGFENAKSDEDKLRFILKSHIDFERIHPFSDGNGRTGRLLMIYSCLEQNLTPIIIPKEEKERYIACLRENNVEQFVEFAKQIQIKEEVRFIKFTNQLENKTQTKELEI
ncbi:Fic family protein [Campylobacter helveticus]|uniref:Fic family protein n=1 Tax=Campylobacter helveticus TaxID=28898 RepID=UPI0022EA749F|nr:Fic family protein [Campylobacter helveticus]